MTLGFSSLASLVIVEVRVAPLRFQIKSLLHEHKNPVASFDYPDIINALLNQNRACLLVTIFLTFVEICTYVSSPI